MVTHDASGDGERLLGGYPGRMLLVIVLGWMTIQTVRYLIPPLLPEIRADFAISLGAAGVVLTILQGSYAVLQYPSGRFSDAWTRTSLIVPALAILGIGCFLIGSAVSFVVLALSTALFGIGKGLFSIPARAMVSDLFVENRGRALGMYGAGSDVGGVIASGLAIVILLVATWRISFLPLAVILLGFGGLFALWTREPYVVRRTNLEIGSTIHRLLAIPNRRWVLIAFMLFYFMVNGVQGFLPAYLREVKGISPELATALFALLFVVGIATRPVVGGASDRFSRHLTATVAMSLSAITLAVLIVAGSVVAITLTVILFAVSFQGLQPVIDALLMDTAPDDRMGSDLGAARTLFTGFGSLGPAFVGVTADVYDYTVAFSVLVLCLVCAVGILLYARRL